MMGDNAIGRVEAWIDGGCNSWGVPAGDIRQVIVFAETYQQMHDTAKELGYPSILEALEALDRLSPDLERG